MTDKVVKVLRCIEFVDVVVCSSLWDEGYGWYARIPEPLTLYYKNGCVSSAEGSGETEEAAIADCIDNLRKCLGDGT